MRLGAATPLQSLCSVRFVAAPAYLSPTGGATRFTSTRQSPTPSPLSPLAHPEGGKNAVGSLFIAYGTVLRSPLPVWFYNRPSRFGSARDRACRVLHLVSAIPPCATRLCYALPVAVLRADAGGGLRPRAKALWVFSPARPTVSLDLTVVIMGDLVIINILAPFRNGSVFLIFCGGARTCDYDKSLTAKSSRLGYHRGFKLPLWRCYALHALMAY